MTIEIEMPKPKKGSSGSVGELCVMGCLARMGRVRLGADVTHRSHAMIADCLLFLGNSSHSVAQASIDRFKKRNRESGLALTPGHRYSNRIAGPTSCGSLPTHFIAHQVEFAWSVLVAVFVVPQGQPRSITCREHQHFRFRSGF